MLIIEINWSNKNDVGQRRHTSMSEVLESALPVDAAEMNNPKNGLEDSVLREIAANWGSVVDKSLRF